MKIHCKKAFTASFDREFNDLKQYLILIEKIGKKMECSPFINNSSYSTRFLQDSNPLENQTEYVIRCRVQCFARLCNYNRENRFNKLRKKGKKHGMFHIHRQFLTFDEFFSRLKFILKTDWMHHSMRDSML